MLSISSFSKRIPVHIIVAGSSWASKLISSFINLLSIRILIQMLGSDQYAAFVILINVAAWYNLADFGVGYSVQNFISELRAKKENYFQYIGTSICLSGILFLILFVFAVLVSPFLGNMLLVQFDHLSTGDKTLLFLTTSILSILFALSGISFKIWYAEQKGYIPNIFTALASIFYLVAIYSISISDINFKLYWALIALLGSNIIFSFFPFIAIAIKIPGKYLALKPNIFKRIFKRAGNFWFFAIMSALVLQIDYIIMSQFVDNDNIVLYNVVYKIFNLAFFVYTAVLAALWPTFSEFMTLKKIDLIKNYTKNYLMIGIVGFLAFSLSMIFLGDYLMNILAPDTGLTIPSLLIIFFGGYFIIRVWTDTFSMILQSMNNLKPLWIFVPFQAIISLILQWQLSIRFGIYGVLSGLILSFLLTVIWALPYSVYKSFNKAK